MSEREQAIKLIENTPDYKIGYVIAYLQGLNAMPEEPNETTYAAMQNAQDGEDMFGPFDSVSDLMEALNA